MILPLSSPLNCPSLILTGNMRLISDCCYDSCNDVAASSARLVAKLSQNQKCKTVLMSNGIINTLVSRVTHRDRGERKRERRTY